ncbi:MAG: LytTR family DNA-binding domain-containing protein [Paludibacter sp.]|nr:LytTR family DNA-binding domain-containing protein [Paludibacter sp.]
MIKEYLHQPYPFAQSRWKVIISISLFIAFFMLVFQPFGLSSYNDKLRIYFEAGYGVVTLVVLIFNLIALPLLIKDWFLVREWNVLNQIVWQIWILFSIGLVNFLYSTAFLSFTNGFYAFLVFQLYTLVVGVIPILIITILHQNAMLSQNLKLANEMNNDLNSTKELLQLDEKVCIMAENNKDKLEVNLSDFIYIASTGNYIQIFFLKDNELKNVLLRNTLKQAEEQLKNCHSIVKCHRAFLVNKNKIVRVKGNSQGLRLVLNDTDEEIPVSKSYSKDLKQAVNN